MSLLQHIDDPSDLRQLTQEQLPQLAAELRHRIIEVTSQREGHLGASLGTVELTVALHYCLDFLEHSLIWDVGHQAYSHKLLTGRNQQFETNRQWQGLAGFPAREESAYDHFGTGHSSTSISAALGMALAAQLQAKDNLHVAVIGDASIASGMAWEAINHAGVTHANVLIILNDNAIGIDPSVGALKEYLTRTSPALGNTVFEAFNLNYTGVVDGHDLNALIDAIEDQKQKSGPRLLHIRTIKGKGLPMAEKDQVRYHAPGKFDPLTGKLLSSVGDSALPKYQDVFGEELVSLSRKHKHLTAITPAMPTGSNLLPMMQEFPDRAIDVGIAEQHAVTLAAGMATQGMRVFCTIYSTFLQRAYDQVIHDVALQKLPVVFFIDRAGLVGHDGATHHGAFDIAYLSCIPNMSLAAPSNIRQLRDLMRYAATADLDGPLAIRYPRGRAHLALDDCPNDVVENRSSIYRHKSEAGKNKTLIISVGTTSRFVESVLGDYTNVDHVDLVWIKPLDVQMLDSIALQYDRVITLEDGVITGGAGQQIAAYLQSKPHAPRVTILGLPDRFIMHGPTERLQQDAGIDAKALRQALDA